MSKFTDMTCPCCRENSPHASAAEADTSFTDSDLSDSVNDLAMQQALLDSSQQLLADQLLADQGGGYASAMAGTEGSDFGAGAWQQQYLQAGLADNSLGLSYGEAVRAAAGASAAFGSSPGADRASSEAEGYRDRWLSQMALESEANSDTPGPWRADQPSRWQRLTGALPPTSPLTLPALDRHAEVTSKADQPLGSNSHLDAEEPVGLWQPSEGAEYSRPAAAFQQRDASSPRSPGSCYSAELPAHSLADLPDNAVVDLAVHLGLSPQACVRLLRAEGVIGVSAGGDAAAGCEEWADADPAELLSLSSEGSGDKLNRRLVAAAASLDETALAAVTHAAAKADSVVEALGLDVDAALLAAAPQHQHLASSTVHGLGSATASEAEALQELGCLSAGLGDDAVPEEFVAGLAAAAAAAAAGAALDEAGVHAAVAAENATSAALAADLAVPVLGPGLLPQGFQQSVMADQSSVQDGPDGEAAEAAVGMADLEGPDQSDVLAAYRQLRQVHGCW